MTLQEAYAEGFCKAAEEIRNLTKTSMQKRAFTSGPVSETAGALLTGLIPFLGHGANVIGSQTGLLSDPSNKERGMFANFIPGVGSHRLHNRIKSQIMNEHRKHGVDSFGQNHAETIGNITSPILWGLLGGSIGGGAGALIDSVKARKLTTGDNTNKGMAYGALAGGGSAALAPLVAAITAAIKRRRTEQEQVEHDRNGRNKVKNLLLPGVATYNKLKRVGRSQGDIEENSKKPDKRSGKNKSNKSNN